MLANLAVLGVNCLFSGLSGEPACVDACLFPALGGQLDFPHSISRW